MRKPFDVTLYNENDLKARMLSKKLVNSFGIECVDNPDKYGPDLLIGSNYYGECEIKHSWKTKTFPFSSINFPERKKKFMKLKMKTKFIMFNSILTDCLVVDSDIVLSSPLIEVKNKYIKSGELFFQVPKKLVKFINLENK